MHFNLEIGIWRLFITLTKILYDTKQEDKIESSRLVYKKHIPTKIALFAVHKHWKWGWKDWKQIYKLKPKTTLFELVKRQADNDLLLTYDLCVIASFGDLVYFIPLICFLVCLYFQFNGQQIYIIYVYMYNIYIYIYIYI